MIFFFIWNITLAINIFIICTNFIGPPTPNIQFSPLVASTPADPNQAGSSNIPTSEVIWPTTWPQQPPVIRLSFGRPTSQGTTSSTSTTPLVLPSLPGPSNTTPIGAGSPTLPPPLSFSSYSLPSISLPPSSVSGPPASTAPQRPRWTITKPPVRVNYTPGPNVEPQGEPPIPE